MTNDELLKALAEQLGKNNDLVGALINKINTLEEKVNETTQQLQTVENTPMELKDLIKIDKTLRKPSVVEQVVSQMVDYIESGTLPDNLCILPDSRKFARELGISPVSGCKIYHSLIMYGEYDKDYNLIIDCKGQAIQRFQDSVRYAVKHGVSGCEMLKMIADITEVDNPCTSIPSVPAKSTFWHNCPICGKYIDDGAADGRCFGCLNAAAKHDTEKQSKHTPK